MTKSVRATVVLTPDQKEMLQRSADDAGLSLSSYILSVALAATKSKNL